MADNTSQPPQQQGQPQEQEAVVSPPASDTPTDSDNDTADDGNAAQTCLVCNNNAIAYAGMPCGCPSLCKRCAMRQATGGRCRVCRQMFGELKRIAD